ncbi:hypothetical protein Q0Y04_08535 [Clostridioides difficile]|nr:hypothetical protein Q0Y04_08535 [Clostridioides difficile]
MQNIKNALAIASAIHALAIHAELTETQMATVAQWGLNAAILACPIF